MKCPVFRLKLVAMLLATFAFDGFQATLGQGKVLPISGPHFISFACLLH
jgi:hypothetical protein